ncbi:glycine cleavage system protein GcvH [Candidatus Pacearchaeota archaeon]|nr:glycine cleavage system protein GcvH [Candidatus Pacearchaeota archaeon]
MTEGEYQVLDELYYSKEHEWAKLEQSGKVRIGITDYAQKTLHEIVFVEIVKVGTKVKQMEMIGTVESIKAVSEVFSPISGEVIEVNEDLIMTPELVNQDPYEEGWIVLIDPDDLKNNLSHLMSANEYNETLKDMEH